MDDLTELAGSVIIEDGEILLLYREGEQHWEVPGGKVEEGESPTETAVREAEEEIGVKVELEKPFYTGEFQHGNDLFLWHGYMSKVVEGRPHVKEDKFSDLDWFDSVELEELVLASSLRMILPSLRRVLK